MKRALITGSSGQDREYLHSFFFKRPMKPMASGEDPRHPKVPPWEIGLLRELARNRGRRKTKKAGNTGHGHSH